ncbi:PREDICTED: sushi, von Willebrand factor type A, EGF and pentraxin domain-containing protein 1-like [Priapulus caudatus]|uniref:Sushi, von Willebrand factor type A, EGF and pentraxin domain-containing protein 1-like n=1 Tax=Priapulus caudatus TaxID=37621 RepID=A0ABM1EWW2_PRICU|nr:PREDICTED: sushi, von Willebrand factor type A, EGF and pentraxin domain-containing protein 1-like [Priapulus caudatus]
METLRHGNRVLLLLPLLLLLLLAVTTDAAARRKPSLNVFRNLTFEPGSSQPTQLQRLYRRLALKHARLAALLRRRPDDQSRAFLSQLQRLRHSNDSRVDVVFVVDSSDSVGADNFAHLVGFVRRTLTHFRVAPDATRVAVVRVTTQGRASVAVDHVSSSSPSPSSSSVADKHQCSLMLDELADVQYVGGGTHTTGALEATRAILLAGRRRSVVKRVVFLLTDGHATSGSPATAVEELRDVGAEIFCVGTTGGHVGEMLRLASAPSLEHTFAVDSFARVGELLGGATAGLAWNWKRRYAEAAGWRCDALCASGDCCHVTSQCACELRALQYECVCKAGQYEAHESGECRDCPAGTYKPHRQRGGNATCRPCPDGHMESPRGSNHLENCTCKAGFRLAADGRCEVTSCEPLLPPVDGYFIPGTCNNIFHAACGIRCSGGYTLSGSSIRICTENGTWTGTRTACRIKSCGALAAPSDGTMTCDSGDDDDGFRYGAVCRFACREGYQMLGTATRSCLSIAHWSGLPVRCREYTCPPLDPVARGVLEPPECATQRARRGLTCVLSCQRGFVLQGPSTRHCGATGRWLGAALSYCLDVTPPDVVGCPGSIVATTLPGENYSVVAWQPPTASDNSELPVALVAHPDVELPVKVEIGEMKVTYKAIDDNGNRATCSFVVTVEDRELPQYQSCPSSLHYYIDDADATVVATWPDVVFTDNSGAPVRTSRSHAPGHVMGVGDVRVVYQAQDAAGNINVCAFNVTVSVNVTVDAAGFSSSSDICAPPTPPRGGNVSCRSGGDGADVCTVSCADGFALASVPPTTYRCTADGWSPTMTFSDCIEAQGTMQADGGDDDDGDDDDGDNDNVNDGDNNNVNDGDDGNDDDSTATPCPAQSYLRQIDVLLYMGTTHARSPADLCEAGVFCEVARLHVACAPYDLWYGARGGEERGGERERRKERKREGRRRRERERETKKLIINI